MKSDRTLYSLLRALRERSSSRTYRNRSAICYREPDLIDLVVGNCDASVGPVLQPVRRSYPAVAAGQAMNKYVSARGNALAAGRSAILRVGIRDVNRLVETAVGIAPIEHLRSLWSLVVALHRLRADGLAAQCDLVGMNYFSSAHKLKGALALQDNHLVNTRCRGRGILRRAHQKTEQHKEDEPSDAHPRDYRFRK